MIKSISYSQAEIIDWIRSLYGEIECDVTYSKGVFYKDLKWSPKLKFDIEPLSEDVKKADCRNLPLGDGSLRSIMFDPPFLATKGKSLSGNEGNIIAQRFTVYETESELFRFYLDSLKEFSRVLMDDGILVVKCQDKISSSLQYLSHVFFINEAEKLGFYCEDMFVLLAKSRLTPEWQVKNQKHARKYHSYFLVFRKCAKKIHFLGEK